MIQRIQTIYMFLSAVAGVISFVLGITATDSDIVVNVFNDELKLGQYVYLALLLLGTLVVCWSIFMYKNRLRQIRFVSLSTTLFALSYIELISCYFITASEASILNIGLFIPLLSIILNMLAISRIKFDERLVTSADRIWK